MSRTITIPKNNKPFIVNINNREYIYRGGETVEVPDEVAEVIEDALELEPKPKRYLSKFEQRIDGSMTELTAGDLDGVEVIAYYAFGHCYSLKNIELPNTIKQIQKSAFTACTSLKSVRFDNNSKVEAIGESAFSFCYELSDVHLPITPPTLANVKVFEGIKADCVFYCKTQASFEAYKAAPIWSTLTGTYSFVVKA